MIKVEKSGVFKDRASLTVKTNHLESKDYMKLYNAACGAICRSSSLRLSNRLKYYISNTY